MKKIFCLYFVLSLFLSSTGCASEPTYQKHQLEYFDLFDTVTIVIVYTHTDEEFEKYTDIIYDEMLRIHQLCDIYNSYDGINNLYTVNINAGVAPVQVDPTIIDLLSLARDAYDTSNGSVNAAMGSVLRIWHDFRQQGIENPELASLPTQEELEATGNHMDFYDVEINEDECTVFLKDAEMSLDVGALAKGFAVQCAIEKARAAGMSSGFISAGGNVYVVGKPMDGRDAWVIGIQNPDTSDAENQIYDTLQVTDIACVTSGDYQRYYEVDGVRYPHIIDPQTLYPVNRYKSVSVLLDNSGVADMLSTALFILPYEEGLALANKYDAQALWIFQNDSVRMTEGYQALSDKY